MVRTIHVSDKAFNLIMAHANANKENSIKAIDELCEVANEAWCMDMPEMIKPWEQFKNYKNKRS